MDCFMLMEMQIAFFAAFRAYEWIYFSIFTFLTITW